MPEYINRLSAYEKAEKMEELARARFESAPARSEERKIFHVQLLERIAFKQKNHVAQNVG